MKISTVVENIVWYFTANLGKIYPGWPIVLFLFGFYLVGFHLFYQADMFGDGDNIARCQLVVPGYGTTAVSYDVQTQHNCRSRSSYNVDRMVLPIFWPIPAIWGGSAAVAQSIYSTLTD